MHSSRSSGAGDGRCTPLGLGGLDRKRLDVPTYLSSLLCGTGALVVSSCTCYRCYWALLRAAVCLPALVVGGLADRALLTPLALAGVMLVRLAQMGEERTRARRGV
jgi:hypothetical protein